MVEPTKGPWVCGDEDEDVAGVEYIDVHAGEYGHGSYRSIAHVQAVFDGEFLPLDDEARANARLIAASLSLLEALERNAVALRRAAIFLADAGLHEVAGDMDQAEERTRAAIALAKGASA